MAPLDPIDVDLSGKTAVVTGASSGIGKQIAANLAGMGAEVIMACRSVERGEAARAEIAAESLEVAELDQSSLASVEAFARRFQERHDRLDILINNAGIYPQGRRLSVDGIELCWATNVMGYFWLSNALADCLRKSAASRLIFIASKLAGGLDLDDVEFERRRWGGIKAYKQSKQANRMLMKVFAEKLPEVSVHAVHPGGIRTNIGHRQRGLWGLLVRLAFSTQKSPAAGADTATYLAAASAIGESGGYWMDRTRVPCEFDDLEQCRELWRRCEAMTARVEAG